jgi:hypothetical protein
MELERELSRKEEEWQASLSDERPTVTEETVAQVIAEWVSGREKQG